MCSFQICQSLIYTIYLYCFTKVHIISLSCTFLAPQSKNTSNLPLSINGASVLAPTPIQSSMDTAVKQPQPPMFFPSSSSGIRTWHVYKCKAIIWKTKCWFLCSNIAPSPVMTVRNHNDSIFSFLNSKGKGRVWNFNTFLV